MCEQSRGSTPHAIPDLLQLAQPAAHLPCCKSQYRRSEALDNRESHICADPYSRRSATPLFTAVRAPASPAESPTTAANATPHVPESPTAEKARFSLDPTPPPDSQS